MISISCIAFSFISISPDLSEKEKSGQVDGSRMEWRGDVELIEFVRTIFVFSFGEKKNGIIEMKYDERSGGDENKFNLWMGKAFDAHPK